MAFSTIMVQSLKLNKGQWVSEWVTGQDSDQKKGQCCRGFFYLWRRRMKFIFFVRVRQEYLNFCRLWQYPSCVKLTQPEENWIFVVLCFDVGIVQREAHGENLIKKFGKNTQLSSTIPELEVNFRNSLSRHFVLLVLAIRSNCNQCNYSKMIIVSSCCQFLVRSVT